MKFIIEDEAIREKESGYLLVIDTMIGDDDGEDAIEVGIFQDNQLHLLEEVINICEEMLMAYPYGRGGDDTYNYIEGFEKWFTEDYLGDMSDIADIAPHKWSYSYDWGNQNTIVGYKLYYLKNGKRYNVEIET